MYRPLVDVAMEDEPGHGTVLERLEHENELLRRAREGRRMRSALEEHAAFRWMLRGLGLWHPASSRRVRGLWVLQQTCQFLALLVVFGLYWNAAATAEMKHMNKRNPIENQIHRLPILSVVALVVLGAQYGFSAFFLGRPQFHLILEGCVRDAQLTAEPHFPGGRFLNLQCVGYLAYVVLQTLMLVDYYIAYPVGATPARWLLVCLSSFLFAVLIGGVMLVMTTTLRLLAYRLQRLREAVERELVPLEKANVWHMQLEEQCDAVSGWYGVFLPMLIVLFTLELAMQTQLALNAKNTGFTKGLWLCVGGMVWNILLILVILFPVANVAACAKQVREVFARVVVLDQFPRVGRERRQDIVSYVQSTEVAVRVLGSGFDFGHVRALTLFFLSITVIAAQSLIGLHTLQSP